MWLQNPIVRLQIPLFSMRTPLRLLLSVILVCSPVASAFAQTPAFTDLKAGSAVLAAATYLQNKGIIKGYSDGSFRPNQKVLRSEALKMIMTAVAPDKLQPVTQTSFTDVPATAWFAPSVNTAQALGVIDGPPKTSTFRPDKTIRKAEFLKLLFVAYKVDTAGAYSEIKLPLASDVQDVNAWYYPLLRYAISSTMLMVATDGTLRPDAELTRADVAQMMYHFFAYRDGIRTQAGLSVAESDLINTLQMIESKNGPQAGYASARALIAARGAYQKHPEIALIQGALKITEAFRSLVTAYTAGTDGRLDDSIAASKDAWAKADRAGQLSSGVSDLAKQLKTVSETMAKEARALKDSAAKTK